MRVLGIDPGAGGALALLNAGKLDIVDMPIAVVNRNRRPKREVDAAQVARIIEDMKPDLAFLELVGPMPKQGVASTFQFGRSLGILQGVLGALQIPITPIRPQEWRKGARVRPGKDGSRARASELFPHYTELFSLKKHHGRAEAALIAFYGRSHGHDYKLSKSFPPSANRVEPQENR